ncbi:hypothetical protein CLK_0219 [Clostridium botulinum A3 str. Loch Maree]|nr:hypothetical protein CLK_0219 [Clostridium botulinum A3 str. Loch Maree]
MQFGLKIDLFKSFKSFKLKMKKVKYSVYHENIISIFVRNLGNYDSTNLKLTL